MVLLKTTGVTKVYPEASMLVFVAEAPSRVSVAFAGKVDVLLTIKLPFMVKVGLDPELNVAALLLVKLPIALVLYLLKSKLDIPVAEKELLLTKLLLKTKDDMLSAVTVPALVNVPLTFTVHVPVPTVIVPLLVRL